MLGIIGGTGLYKLPNLSEKEELHIDTPFGNPSSPVMKGKVHGNEILFLARHGTQHGLLPHEVNYAANLFALKQAGARSIISISAVGSLQEHYKPGDLVCIDQYLDMTKGKRRMSYFGEGVVAHIQSATPVSAIQRELIINASQKIRMTRTLHHKGTYTCVEGPRLGTKAESHMMRTLGADIVGMTNVPEVFLAREAQLAYSSIGVVTDYDSWMEDSSKHVDVEQIFEVYSKSISDVIALLEMCIQAYKAEAIEACESRRSLRGSLRTPVDSLPPEKQMWLSTLLS